MFKLIDTIFYTLMISTCAAIKMNACNIKLSNFFKVRETTCAAPTYSDLWFKQADQLSGSDSSDGNYGTDCFWNIYY